MTTIVLAAGLSSRMGDNKLMLLYQDKPIIRVTVEKAISASDRVIVVLGHDKERVEDAISGLDAGTVFNPVYTSGMKSSIIAGIEAVSDDDFAILPGDLPLIEADDMEGTYRLLKDHEIARAIHGGLPGHPVAFRRNHRDKLIAFPGGMKEYLALYDVAKHNASEGSVYDIDTQEKYQALLSGDYDL